MTAREDFMDLVERTKTYFVDNSAIAIDDKKIDNWSTIAMLLASGFKDNVLLLGEPGYGKTTAAKVISSMTTGLPFDLYESAQMQGHPEQTKEELIARPDFGVLQKGEEKVVWQLAAYLPAVIIDEFNRLPPGKQDLLINIMETGRWSYLNETLFHGKAPFYATANHPDDGNHVIIPAMADRFRISLEIPYLGAGNEKNINDAEQKIREELCNPKIVDNVFKIANNSEIDTKQKLEEILACRKDTQDFITPVIEESNKLKVSPEAQVFYDALSAELNYNGRKGIKRSNEAIAMDNHTQELAGAKVLNSLSPRGLDAIMRYARALAYINEDKTVEKKHIISTAPYILRHRMQFTDDFRAEYEETSRKNKSLDLIWTQLPNEDLFLAQKLVGIVDKNYQHSIMEHVGLINAFGRSPEKLTKKQKEEAEKMVKNWKNIDHPFLQYFAYQVKGYLNI